VEITGALAPIADRFGLAAAGSRANLDGVLVSFETRPTAWTSLTPTRLGPDARADRVNEGWQLTVDGRTLRYPAGIGEPVREALAAAGRVPGLTLAVALYAESGIRANCFDLRFQYRDGELSSAEPDECQIAARVPAPALLGYLSNSCSQAAWLRFSEISGDVMLLPALAGIIGAPSYREVMALHRSLLALAGLAAAIDDVSPEQ